MRAILVREPGAADRLELGEFPDPEPAADELLVRVKAAALNRADILQRMGRYPPPPGASPLLGLEVAGVVERAGSRCAGWSPGDRVFALLAGGGYAERAAVPCDQALRIPDRLSFEEAAAVPEAFLTAFQCLFWLGRLRGGEWALVHAGASGVGTAAIQLVREAGARAIVTAGSAAKLRACRELGAEIGLDYHEGDFAPRVLEATGGRGVDVILDLVGASYWRSNVACLAPEARLVLVGSLGGRRVDGVDLDELKRRWAHVVGTTLRSRDPAYKARLAREFLDFAGERLAEGRLRAVVDRVFPWQRVADAHRWMEENRNVGKIVLAGEWP